MKLLAITVSMIASIYFSCFAESTQQTAKENETPTAQSKICLGSRNGKNQSGNAGGRTISPEEIRQKENKLIKELKNSEISSTSQIKGWVANSSTNDVTIMVCCDAVRSHSNLAVGGFFVFRELTFGSNGVLKAISPVIKITNNRGKEITD